MLGESAHCKLSSKIKDLLFFILQEGYPYILVVCTSLPTWSWMQSVQINWMKHWKTKNVTFNRLLTKPLEHSTQILILYTMQITVSTTQIGSGSQSFLRHWPFENVEDEHDFLGWWLLYSQLNTTVWLWLCEGPNNDCIMPTKREHILQSFVLRTCQET